MPEDALRRRAKVNDSFDDGGRLRIKALFGYRSEFLSRARSGPFSCSNPRATKSTQTTDQNRGNEDGTQSLNAKVKGYFLLNLHANYEAQKGLDYFARIHNVFDRRFETYGLMAESMFTAQGQVASGSTVSRFVAPGAPRSFLVGIRYRF